MKVEFQTPDEGDDIVTVEMDAVPRKDECVVLPTGEAWHVDDVTWNLQEVDKPSVSILLR